MTCMGEMDDADRAKEHISVSARRRMRALIADVSAELSAAARPVDIGATPMEGLFDTWNMENTDLSYQEYPWLTDVLDIYPF